MDTISQPLIALITFTGLALVLALILWPGSGLLPRWQRSRRMNERVLIEDALKHLYKDCLYNRRPTIHSLAGAVGITTDHAAQLLDRLAELELVELTEDGYSLTAEGETYALNVIRAHRLWERYLADETGYRETEWHEMADSREHTLSPAEMTELSAVLGYPSYDPHGDPIPTPEGDLVGHGGQPLTIMQPGQVMRIVHLEDEPDTIYAQLMAEGIYPGMQLRLLETSPTRIRFWAGGREHILAPVTAANISVKPLPEREDLDVSAAKQLNVLQQGESAKVLRLSSRLRGMERRRLLDLGVIPGTIVRAEFASPSGDPVAYRIRGALIALREDQARLIDIERIQQKEDQQKKINNNRNNGNPHE
jgi:DtxR family transcriptional regulator, Mn-dependent transcriptional regulator